MTRAISVLAASVFGVIAIGVAAPANAQPTVPFKNCTAAKAAGYCDIPTDSPLYTPSQDRDRDGVACEC
ncbi:excalibur calcium-binding domain-containing protein [Mycobacterium crocinum]|uniref:Excalibur calcium-binding domain-containing protein n=1 Tax=Mycolicibacterium crocinum TaxID=388459 RepID=A0ABY3TN73_9MYCO|nr:excalibur calcium-binding domain-containing protein [Mycolicibacterium crocinum]MCV7217162.1 excalibur calcium-binding domain-containing protein [Mycolicibacterium crocinum]ULN42907.1 excalibur calcium-binding domain-containing protein [Mycolicibacterium crocinum]